jgi:hypothetical protein
MKPVLVFLITFVVGTAAATGAKVMTTKAGSAKAEAARPDSTASHDSTQKSTDTATTPSGHPIVAPSDTLPRPTAPAGTVATTGAVAAKGTAASAKTDSSKHAPTAVAAAPEKRDTMIQASERRVAKVFTSMEAKQAAKVLEHMSDGDVHIILGYVGPRQAASIMAELPPERVARLSKIAMSGGHSK